MSHECKCIERLIRNNQVYSEAFEVDSNLVSTRAGNWWAFRILLHHRKILPTIRSWHVLFRSEVVRVKTWPGNVHKTSCSSLRRERIADGRTWLGRILPLEFRTDGRFLLRVYRAVRERKRGYAIAGPLIGLAACGRRAQALESDHRGQGLLRAFGLSCRLRKYSPMSCTTLIRPGSKFQS
jgi:hypothetical protein